MKNVIHRYGLPAAIAVLIGLSTCVTQSRLHATKTFVKPQNHVKTIFSNLPIGFISENQKTVN